MADTNKNLSDDLDDMIGDVKENAKAAADKAGEYANEAKEKAAEFAGDAKEKLTEFADDAKDAFNKATGKNKKVLAGVLAILFGSLGVHKFILGYNKEGVILLAATILLMIFSFGLLGWLVGIFTLIEGIIYLTKSDEEFYNTYQVGKKPWF